MMHLQWLGISLAVLCGLVSGQSPIAAGTPSPSPQAGTTAGGLYGITRDETDEGYYHWSSVAVFKDEDQSKLTDDTELAALAMAAYNEMLADIQSTGNPDSNSVVYPIIMSALAVKNKVYFSSSLTGPAFMYTTMARDQISPDVAGEVARALMRCQIEASTDNPVGGRASGHRTGATCGEPLAAQQYCVDNPGVSLAEQNAVVVSWGIPNRGVSTDQAGIRNPCQGDPAEIPQPWGCEAFLRTINVRAVRNTGIHPGNPTLPPVSTYQACFWGS